MNKSDPYYRQRARGIINSILGIAGFEIVRKNRGFQNYIPLAKTLSAAHQAGMPLGDYIDATFNVPGSTQRTIDSMAELGVFNDTIERVCELGPGSGRYLERIISICKPDHYEIYETAEDWRNWLIKTYNVIGHIPDGMTLSMTPSRSIDLIHTHKMLYGNPIITICKYFLEMERVVQRNGWIVFDIVTEECLTEGLLMKWIESGVDHACSMTSKNFAIDFFTKRGLSFEGSFFIPLKPGITEYLVFHKSE